MINIRLMRRDEFDMVVKWATKEGWNPGRNDASHFFETDPGGFFIAELDNEPIASISIVRFNHDYAFLGFYIVREAYRGKGYGKALWDYAVAQTCSANPNINIGLDGVVAQQNNYTQSGFQYNYANIRYRGIATHRDIPEPSVQMDVIRPVVNEDIQGIVDYDYVCTGVQRDQFVTRWLKDESHTAWVVSTSTNTETTSGGIHGYGVIRQCHEGFKVGPLFADSVDQAHRLLRQLTATIKDQTFFLDVPEPNKTALSVVAENNMEPVFETARMHTGQLPGIQLQRVFGVTTFELG